VLTEKFLRMCFLLSCLGVPEVWVRRESVCLSRMSPVDGGWVVSTVGCGMKKKAGGKNHTHAIGGPGAVFWMWISAVLGMSTIFSEAVLSQKYREIRDGQVVGGPAYYISRGLKSRVLAIIFSVMVIVALGFIGCMVQANSISIGLANAFGMKGWVSGILIAVLVAVVIVGGQKRVTTIAELVAKGAVRKNQPVKVLGNGEITVKVNVTVDKASASAIEKIKAAGGSVTVK